MTDNPFMWFSGFVFAAAVLFFIYSFGWYCGEQSRQEDAINEGYGEYFLDDEHNKQFRFKNKV